MGQASQMKGSFRYNHFQISPKLVKTLAHLRPQLMLQGKGLLLLFELPIMLPVKPWGG
jgi:hypothetical protein